MPAIVPLIIAGVSAGTSVYAAKKQSETAQQAAKTQVESGNKALDLQTQQYQQQQRNLSPYLQLGQSVLPGLQQMAGQRPPQFVPPGMGGPSSGWPGQPPVPRVPAGPNAPGGYVPQFQNALLPWNNQ